MSCLGSFLQQYTQNNVVREMLIMTETSRMIASATETQNVIVISVVKRVFVVVVVVVISGVGDIEGVLESVPVTFIVVVGIGVGGVAVFSVVVTVIPK